MIELTTKKVVEVEDSKKDIESLFNESGDSDDNDFDRLFESISDYKDESLDSNAEKSVAATKAKVREKGFASTKKGNGLLVKKPVSKVAGKRKSSDKDIGKGPGPSSKSAKTAKGTSLFEKATT